MVARGPIETDKTNESVKPPTADCSLKLYEACQTPTKLAFVTEGGGSSTSNSNTGDTTPPTNPVESTTPASTIPTETIQTTSTPPKTEGGVSSTQTTSVESTPKTLTTPKTVEVPNEVTNKPLTPPVLPPLDFDLFPGQTEPPQPEVHQQPPLQSPFIPVGVQPPRVRETEPPPPPLPSPIPFEGITTGEGKVFGKKEIHYTKAPSNKDITNLTIPGQITGAEIEPARAGKGKQEGQLLPPSDPFAIGSYKVPGTEWLIAHDIAHGRPGPFYAIDQLKYGEEITLHQNGKDVAYKVVDKKSFSRDDKLTWKQVLTPAPVGAKDELKLVTCGGATDRDGWHLGRTAVTLVRSDGLSSTKQPDTGMTQVTFQGREPEVITPQVTPPGNSTMALPPEVHHTTIGKGQSSVQVSATRGAAADLDSRYIRAGISTSPGGAVEQLGAHINLKAGSDRLVITPKLSENTGGSITGTESQSIINSGTSLGVDVRDIHLLSSSTAIELRAGAYTNPTQTFGQGLVVQKLGKVILGAGVGEYTSPKYRSTFGLLGEGAINVSPTTQIVGGLSEGDGNTSATLGLRVGL